MKIAVVSDDGVSISRHFGRAASYTVVTVENGRVVSKETRPKTGHQTFAGYHHQLSNECHHGYGAGARARHESMVKNISDCQVLIAGGMGMGAYENLNSSGIELVVTDVDSLEQAVKLYLAGQLTNKMERLH